MEAEGSSISQWMTFRQRPDLGLEGGDATWAAWVGQPDAKTPFTLSTAAFLDLIAEPDREPFLAHIRKSISLTQWVFAKFRLRSGPAGPIRSVAEWRRCLPTTQGISGGFEVIWFNYSFLDPLRNPLLQSYEKSAIVELTSGFIHDLNNALAGVSSMADLSLMDLDRRHPLRKNLRNILESTRRAAGLIDRFGRLLQGKSGERDYHDMRVLAQETLAFLRPTIPRRIELKCHASDAPLPVCLDARALRLVLFSLALDAASTLKTKGRIEFHTTLKKPPFSAKVLAGSVPKLPSVTVTVSNSGPGIDPARQESILRMDASSYPDQYGLGVGLAHALDFVCKCQGALTLDGSPAQNTAITLWLPLADLGE